MTFSKTRQHQLWWSWSCRPETSRWGRWLWALLACDWRSETAWSGFVWARGRERRKETKQVRERCYQTKFQNYKHFTNIHICAADYWTRQKLVSTVDIYLILYLYVVYRYWYIYLSYSFQFPVLANASKTLSTIKFISRQNI